MQCLNKTACQTCETRYMLNSTDSKCVSCSLNCFKCKILDKCDQCLGGYGLNTTNLLQCLTCNSSNILCLNCTFYGQCTNCQNISYANLDTGICDYCNVSLSYCFSCAGNSFNLSCTKCVDNTVFLNSSSYKCQLCSDLFYECLACNQ